MCLNKIAWFSQLLRPCTLEPTRYESVHAPQWKIHMMQWRPPVPQPRLDSVKSIIFFKKIFPKKGKKRKDILISDNKSPNMPGPWGIQGFWDSSVGKEYTCNAGDSGLGVSWIGKTSWRRDRLPTPGSLGFPYGSAGKESTCNGGDMGSILGLGRSPGEGKGYPLQYSGLENSMDCTVHGVTKSQTWLSELWLAIQGFA